MAIAKAECTCAACGKKFEVRVSRSNSREAASFEEWAKAICVDVPYHAMLGALVPYAYEEF